MKLFRSFKLSIEFKQLLTIGSIVILYFLSIDTLKSAFDDVFIKFVVMKFKPEGLPLLVVGLYLLTLICAGYYVIIKVVKTAYRTSFLSFFFLGWLVSLFWYERLAAHDYVFSSLIHKDVVNIGIKFLDPLFTMLTVLWLVLFFEYFQFRTYGTGIKSVLKQDGPIFKIADDRYNRGVFFENLIAELKKISFDGKKGFAMGINSSWGSGKTSLLEIIKGGFIPERDIILIDYNPWLATSKISLTQDFFAMIENKLSEHIETHSLIKRYGEKISKIDEEKNPLKKIADLFNDENSLKEQFDEIALLIKKTNKKLFVIIDDLDRLDNSEVIDVLRLIRNTANFPRINFIVAYDRNYLINALDNLKIHHPKLYLEKIFDIELILPKIENVSIIEELNAALKDGFDVLILDVNQKEALIDQLTALLFNIGGNEKTSGVKPLLIDIFKGKREILKFSNSLFLLFAITRQQVYFPDLFILELIKFKSAEVYKLIARNDRYLNISNLNGIRAYSLYKEDSSAQSDQNLLLNDFRKPMYEIKAKLPEGDDKTIFEVLITALFTSPADDYMARHSIFYTDNFERYFINANPQGSFGFDELDRLIAE